MYSPQSSPTLYLQKLNQSKATLETRQSEVSAVSELKTGLDKQMSALRGGTL